MLNFFQTINFWLFKFSYIFFFISLISAFYDIFAYTFSGFILLFKNFFSWVLLNSLTFRLFSYVRYKGLKFPLNVSLVIHHKLWYTEFSQLFSSIMIMISIMVSSFTCKLFRSVFVISKHSHYHLSFNSNSSSLWSENMVYTTTFMWSCETCWRYIMD